MRVGSVRASNALALEQAVAATPAGARPARPRTHTTRHRGAQVLLAGAITGIVLAIVIGSHADRLPAGEMTVQLGWYGTAVSGLITATMLPSLLIRPAKATKSSAKLAQVARNTTGPPAAELARVLQEMQIGKSGTEALHAMVERTTVTEFRAFVSALVRAGELGISVAQVLREQAKELRLKRRQRAEEQAQKVSVKIMFPLIAGLFPALFVIVIGPGAVSIVHALHHGQTSWH
jgi:type II secretion system (T2SS) protein F